MNCEHKTEAEYGACNRCSAFARIARSAKALLGARKVFLSHLLSPGPAMDAAQEIMIEKLVALERDVKFADDAKLWD